MEQNLNRITEVELTTSAVGFCNTMLAVVSLPSEVEKFMTAYKLSFGKWYSPFKDGSCYCHQLTDFVFHDYWGWQLLFHTKVKYTIEGRDFTWFEVSEPKTEVEDATVQIDSRKELDNQYYKLKSRHELLCQKKLDLMRQGKNTTMRNAYINQKLEMLRSQLSEYRSSCITANVLRLGEGCQTDTQISQQTQWQLLPNRCYVLGGLSALNLI